MNDEYLIYGETLTAIADSIRSVSSVSTTWTPDEMAAYILANLVKPTTRQAAKTYTPGTSNQTIPAGTFLTGAATIQGDADLTAANIKKGVNIFGKTGTLSGVWGDASTFYGFTAIKSGSLTIASQTTTAQTITHNLGIIPRMVVIGTDSSGLVNTSTAESTIIGGGFMLACTTQTPTSLRNKLSNGFIMTTGFAGNQTYTGFANMHCTYSNASPYYEGTEASWGNITGCNTSKFIFNGGGSGGYMYPGTYKWLVMG